MVIENLWGKIEGIFFLGWVAGLVLLNSEGRFGIYFFMFVIYFKSLKDYLILN